MQEFMWAFNVVGYGVSYSRICYWIINSFKEENF